MGFFNSTPTPDTVDDKTIADLTRRAQKAAPPMFSARATQQRFASNAQRGRAQQS